MTGLHSHSAEAYHRDDVADRPTLSSSVVNILLNSSPAHARAAHPKLNPDYKRTEDDKFSVGTVAHALLLQGLEVAEIMDYPDWRSNAAKEARDLARSHGRIPMLGKQWEEVQAMVNAVATRLGQLDVDPIPFTAGQPERTLVWEEDGVLCRARLDWLHDDGSAVDDLKTTSRSANPESWSRTLFGIGCDVQAAFYMRGLKSIGLETEWRWVVCETAAPYELAVVSLAPAVWQLANAKVDVALNLWKRCLETDSWPGYPSRVCFAELPAFEESRWLAREAREEMAA